MLYDLTHMLKKKIHPPNFFYLDHKAFEIPSLIPSLSGKINVQAANFSLLLQRGYPCQQWLH